MPKVSILIPSRNERFLSETVADLQRHATGDYEIVVVLDGYWPSPMLPDHPRLKVIHFGGVRGMRAAINAAASVATGAYLMKCDAHCSFQEGFDEVLAGECDQDWIVIPRRDRLDAEAWGLQETGKPPIDYHYLSCPITNEEGYSMHGADWRERTRARSDPAYDLDETMSFQGSCWFMARRHWDRLGGMGGGIPPGEEGYGTFTQEPQEIGNKTWLSGGRVMVNKRTTYLHLHKGKQYGRGYSQDRAEVKAGHLWSARYWMHNQWPERVHDLEWLVDRFWPVPTWPEDWRERKEACVKLDL